MLSQLRFLGAISRGRIPLAEEHLPQPVSVLNEGIRHAIIKKKYSLTLFLLNTGADPAELETFWSVPFNNNQITTFCEFLHLVLTRGNLSVEEKIQHLLATDINPPFVLRKIQEFADNQTITKYLEKASLPMSNQLVSEGLATSSDIWKVISSQKHNYHELFDLSALWKEFPLPENELKAYQKALDDSYYQNDPIGEFWDLIADGNNLPRLQEVAESLHDRVEDLLIDHRAIDTLERGENFFQYFTLDQKTIEKLFVRSLELPNIVSVKLLEIGAVWTPESFAIFLSALHNFDTTSRRLTILSFLRFLKNHLDLILGAADRLMAGEICLELTD